jgi:membrane protein DedA with SNARE-associated domain
LLFDGAVFERNPLLTPAGYLLLIDWNSVWSWKLCALSAAVLSFVIVYWINDVSGEYRIAQDKRDNKLLKSANKK